MTIRTLTSGAAAAATAALVAFASPSFAQEVDEEIRPDRACMMECREAARECHAAAKEDLALCFEDSGCEALRDEFQAACTEETRETEACMVARDAFKECAAPCREALRDELTMCREDAGACFVDVCGEAPREERRRRWHRSQRRG